jgi:hypothetical protein
MRRWLRRWRDRDDRQLNKSAAPVPDGVDPIEELDRLISEAQERDAKGEGRFERLSAPNLIRDRCRPGSDLP